MKHRVLKCKLDFHTTQQIYLPAEAEILSVQWQECSDMTRGLMLWYKTPVRNGWDIPDMNKVVTIKIVETDRTREDLDDCRCLATVQCPNDYVLHVFVKE